MDTITSGVIRCAKCWGRTCGEPQYTGDYMCYCLPETNTGTALQGWICPRCGAIHSPLKLTCDCTPFEKFGVPSSTSGILWDN